MVTRRLQVERRTGSAEVRWPKTSVPPNVQCYATNQCICVLANQLCPSNSNSRIIKTTVTDIDVQSYHVCSSFEWRKLPFNGCGLSRLYAAFRSQTLKYCMVVVLLQAHDTAPLNCSVLSYDIKYIAMLCKAPWSATLCRTTSMHSRTVSSLDSTSLATSMLSALETS